jgi:phenylacetic acid degradation operon negative regulatory protein
LTATETTNDGGVAANRPPRVRARSQRLLVTLLGDYWRGRDRHIPSATLVRVLGEFDVSPANARAALARLARRDLLARTKNGRRTYYDLTDRARRLLDLGGERIFGLGAKERSWDGTWTMVIFSIPDADRDLRHLFRSRLRWLTFSPLYDAVWVSPHDRSGQVLDLADELNLDDVTVLRTDGLSFRADSRARLDRAWDLRALADRYQRYLDRHRPLAAKAERGEVRPAEALVGRVELVDEWRQFARDDPDLPVEFLPAGFPRAQARELFIATYATLTQPAQQRFEELVGLDAPPGED